MPDDALQIIIIDLELDERVLIQLRNDPPRQLPGIPTGEELDGLFIT